MSEPEPAHRTVSILDAALVLIVALTMAGVLAGLFFVKVPQANLPIVASISSALMGLVIGGYAGFRWAASEASKRTPPAVAVSVGDPDGTASASVGKS